MNKFISGVSVKLIVQIPCYNEEKTLPTTVRNIPRKIDGVNEVEILVIDDGSADRTAEVAREIGVDYLIRFKNNKGLAKAFSAGIDACLKLGADVIVNTDGDNQYNGADIRKLIQPILDGKADIVVGVRDIDNIGHFTFLKKKFQKLGSWVVRQVSSAEVSDTTSGFRALSREAALRLNVLSPFTYTLETIIQAQKKYMVIDQVPVQTNEKLRDSRLFSSMWRYIAKSIVTIIRIYTMYQPLRVFFYVGGTAFLAGFLIGVRFLYFYLANINPSGHIQSLIFSAVLLILGFQLMMIGLVADIISANRRLIEDALFRVRSLELELNVKADAKRN